MTNYQFHELCVLFPPCSDEELESLRDSIEKNGVIEPVTMFEGKILDGRNRFTACLMIGIDPPTVEYTGDDPVAFVLSKNLHRRHLDASQRAMVAARLASIPHGGDRKTDQSANLRFEKSQEEASKIMNVSRRSTQAAKKILKEADEKTIKEIEAGKKSITKASKELKESKSSRKKTGTGQTPMEMNPASGLPENLEVDVTPESDPVQDLVLLAREKKISIIAAIRLIDNDISEYCDIAPHEMVENSIPEFILAFCELFDAGDVQKVVSGLKKCKS